jgi:hypothetical protein
MLKVPLQDVLGIDLQPQIRITVDVDEARGQVGEGRREGALPLDVRWGRGRAPLAPRAGQGRCVGCWVCECEEAACAPALLPRHAQPWQGAAGDCCAHGGPLPRPRPLLPCRCASRRTSSL